MKVSWSFLVALLAGFLLMFGLLVGAFCLNLGVPSPSSRWAFELNQKKRHMADQAASPRLLLVGGSATLFGLSAKEIEAQTGCHTINLGTHAALGTSYILRLAEQTARPGDTVLLVLEYELYTYGKLNQAWADKILVDYIVSRDPAFFHGLSIPEQWNLFMLTPISRLVDGLKNRRRPEIPFDDSGFGVYSVRHLNKWGDLTGHTSAHRLAQRESILKLKSVLGRGLPEHPEGFTAIASFCRWAQTNRIRVLATFPNICDQPEYHSPAAQHSIKIIEDFFARLGVPVVGEYTDAILPEEELLDTIYHPTEEAALARTQRLIPKLNAALKRGSETTHPDAGAGAHNSDRGR
jgi:hypothetical protein